MVPLWFLGCPCVHPSLWAQLRSAQTSDSADASTACKTQFLQKMQATVSLLSLLEWGMWYLALNLVRLGSNSWKAQNHSQTPSLGKGRGLTTAEFP